MLRELVALEGRFAFLRARGTWWWAALGVGAVVRVALVLFTEGTLDVPIWQAHAESVRKFGLVGYYERQEVFNHPPFMGMAMAVGWAKAIGLGVPFAVYLRAPFALLDLGTALLLSHALRDAPHRHLVFAAYWLNPLAMLLSAYHGNTDSAVAFFSLLAVVAAGRGRAIAAGAAIGVGLWIKPPVVLAGPALFFALEGARRRLKFAGTALAVAITSFLPVMVTAPALLVSRVVAYPGLRVESPDGTPIWTLWDLFGLVDRAPESLRGLLDGAMQGHAAVNSMLCLGAVVGVAWLRRRERGVRELGFSVLAGQITFYALNHNFFSFQYFAWSIPFWYFAPLAFVVAATVLIGGYLYGAYALFCGDLLLRGKWDFYAFASWPRWLLALRDASLLLCAGSAITWLRSSLTRRGFG